MLREVALHLGLAQFFTMPVGNFLQLSFGKWILGRYWLVDFFLFIFLRLFACSGGFIFVQFSLLGKPSPFHLPLNCQDGNSIIPGWKLGG